MKTPQSALKIIEEEIQQRNGRLLLNHCGLTEIPSEIQGLTWIREIVMYGNRISEIKGLENLLSLRYLDLNDNNISELKGLENLTKLEHLRLAKKKITEIKGLDTLKNLLALTSYDNQLSEIKGLNNLHNPQHLNLRENKISEIKGIEHLIKLKILDLGHNNISSIEPLKILFEFKKLSDVSLWGNQISDLSPLIPFLKMRLAVRSGEPNDIVLKVYSNPLINPHSSLIEREEDFLVARSIIRYFDEVEKFGEIENDQVKVIFLGNTRSGKTSLAKYIQSQDYDPNEQSTHGINNFSWSFSTLLSGEDLLKKINAWDFGGQQYFHATHRLFLTNDTVYVVICSNETENTGWDADGTQNHLYTYWLDLIAYYTRTEIHEAKKMTVIMVQTKCDKENYKPMHLSDDIKRKYIINEQEDFYRISIEDARKLKQGGSSKDKKNAREFEQFKLRLIDLLEEKRSKFKIPKIYPRTRDILGNHASPVITKEEYEIIVKNVASKVVMNPQVNHDLLRWYLMDCVGNILQFPYNENLKNKIWISPTWLHEKMYKILSRKVLERKGRLSIDDIKNGLSEIGTIEKFEDMNASEMISLLKELNIIFEIDENNFIIPQYLPMECDVEKKKELDTALKYGKFSHRLSIIFPYFLPPATISQYIAIKGASALKNIYWKYGLLYEHKVGDSLVDTYIFCNPQKNEIQIRLPENENKILCNAVVENFVDTIVIKLTKGKDIVMLQKADEYNKGEIVSCDYDSLVTSKKATSCLRFILTRL